MKPSSKIQIKSEKELLKILIRDNGEKLVNVSKFNSYIKTILPLYVKKAGMKNILVRETVAKKLSVIQSELPINMNLIVTSGFRPLKIQEEIYKAFFKKIKKDNPTWSDNKIRKETRKIVAPPENIPPHSTGGAIDLTIYKGNKPLDMGCGIPMSINISNPNVNKFPTNSKYITKRQQKNRRFLSEIMIKYDFVNLESEWWHWSYGDRYWAATKKKSYAIYGGKNGFTGIEESRRSH